MPNTTILKEEQSHLGIVRFKHTRAPQFPLELCINSQNNADSFLHKKYTLNGNEHQTIIMITVKDFRYTPEKVVEQSKE
jgi:hypothetical protein